MREASIGAGPSIVRPSVRTSWHPRATTIAPEAPLTLFGEQDRAFPAARPVPSKNGAAGPRGARRRSAPTGSRLTATAIHSIAQLSSSAASFRRRTGMERRLMTVFVLALVLAASVMSEARPAGPIGGADLAGTGQVGRLAGLDALPEFVVTGALAAQERSDSVDPGVAIDPALIDEGAANPVALGGPYLPDGTLLKPVAVEGTLPNLERSDVVVYKVRSGDTLTGIAARFRVSMMTLWWANDLGSKDSLRAGQELVIPPSSGILWTVKEGDTLESIAKETKGDVDRIREYNGLVSDTLIIGQVLMVPGGRGDPIPTPKPTAKPIRSGGGGTSYRGSGTLRWPVDGGYISQYYWSGHRAIDIAASYGTNVRAAAYGKVTWAGWRSNCGGYQIWVDHLNGMSTTYNHLSSILVGAGSYVSRGQLIGRIGTSGCTTGPHLHFAVWIGPIWNGGYEVNPLLYL